MAGPQGVESRCACTNDGHQYLAFQLGQWGEISAFCKSRCPGLGAPDGDSETDLLKVSCWEPLSGAARGEREQNWMEQSESALRMQQRPRPNLQGALEPRRSSKDVRVEAMGTFLWTLHQSLIGLAVIA